MDLIGQGERCGQSEYILLLTDMVVLADNICKKLFLTAVSQTVELAVVRDYLW